VLISAGEITAPAISFLLKMLGLFHFKSSS